MRDTCARCGCDDTVELPHRNEAECINALQYDLRDARAALAECEKEYAEAVRALAKDLDIIQQWHGPVAWDIYKKHAPELDLHRAALSTDRARRVLEVRP